MDIRIATGRLRLMQLETRHGLRRYAAWLELQRQPQRPMFRLAPHIFHLHLVHQVRLIVPIRFLVMLVVRMFR